MKIISPANLRSADPDHECFIIKNVFTTPDCQEVVGWLSEFLATTRDNEKFQGQNWHYHVLNHGNDFHSFLFNDLKKLQQEKLTRFYKVLFDLYQAFGERTQLNDFESEISRSEGEGKTLNPLVFWYPAGVGKFNWHQHPGTYQRFQLLCNLTRPKVDYQGGETLVDMGDLIEKFAEDFEQGDVFSFPYTQRHMVTEVLGGEGGLNSRVSLLMPLHPRQGMKGVSY